MQKRLVTHGKANKGLGGLRGFISRFNFTNRGTNAVRIPYMPYRGTVTTHNKKDSFVKKIEQ